MGVVRQAVTVAAAVKGRAVQLVWSREEDVRHDMYRPAAMSKLRASLNRAELPEVWHQRLASASVSSDFVGRVLNAEMFETPEKINVEGAALRACVIDNMRLERVACAVGAGFAVHPDQLSAQMEGGIVFGLSAMMYGWIDFADSTVVQSNFHDYPVLRTNELRDVQVEVLNGATGSDSTLGGVGESGIPPAGPALCNALFAATGQRVPVLSLASSGFTASAP